MGADPASSRRSGRRIRRARLGVAVFSTLVGLLAAEWAWREFRTSGFGPTTNPRYVRRDPLLGWSYAPGSSARHATDEFDVQVEIGPTGFRAQPDLPSAPPAVLLLGDSFTFGWGVEGDQTFGSRLRQRIGRPVWNLGVSGFGTDQQLLLLRAIRDGGHRELSVEKGRFRPRVVILTFCSNDLEEVRSTFQYGSGKPVFRLEGEDLVLEGVPVETSWLERRSELFRSIRKVAHQQLRSPLDPVELDRSKALVIRLYREISREASGLGARTLVLHSGQAWIEKGLDGGPECAVLDLRSALAGASQQTHFQADGHWTANGHRVVAEAISAFLQARGWL